MVVDESMSSSSGRGSGSSSHGSKRLARVKADNDNNS